MLVSYSQRFLDAMTRPELLAKFPRGVRAIGGMTLATAEAAHLDAPAKFVGGFLVLRLLAPALTAPNTAHLVPENTELTELTRRNLVLLSKVIQTLSNRTTVLKEESMKALKEFFDSNFDKMEAFLLEFAQDPQNKEQPFSDLIGAKPKEDATIDKDTLSELHKFLFENLQAFKEAKQPQVCPSHFISTFSYSTQTVQQNEVFNGFIAEIEKLGAPSNASFLTTVANVSFLRPLFMRICPRSHTTFAATIFNNNFFKC